MRELWRWNGHRTRSGSRAPEHDLAWQLPAPTVGQTDTVSRRLCLEAASAYKVTSSPAWRETHRAETTSTDQYLKSSLVGL
jgi:hypothetical protein